MIEFDILIRKPIDIACEIPNHYNLITQFRHVDFGHLPDVNGSE